jgi:hypothetical protein
MKFAARAAHNTKFSGVRVRTAHTESCAAESNAEVAKLADSKNSPVVRSAWLFEN